MVGTPQTKAKLNNTLYTVSKLLNENNIDNWFVAYGTLLGIVRENSCIDKDDDIDIICDKKNYNKVKDILKNKFTFHYDLGIGNSKNILKIRETEEFSSVDFYMADIDKKGNFIDTWERQIWSNCYLNNKLIKHKFKDTFIYLPNNAETKLKNRYGDDWKIPKNVKKFWAYTNKPKNWVL